jgi:hypothetical protein
MLINHSSPCCDYNKLKTGIKGLIPESESGNKASPCDQKTGQGDMDRSK